MSIPKEGSRDIGDGIIVSVTPDVCKTPVGSSTPPIPYSVFAKQADDANTTATVRMTGKRAHNMASLVTKTQGDAPGSAGGVKSGTTGAACHPKTHSSSVNIQGKPAIRHTDEWYMNNKNTVGKLTYVKDTGAYPETPAVDLYRARDSELPSDMIQLADASGGFTQFLEPGPAIETTPPTVEVPPGNLPTTPGETSPSGPSPSGTPTPGGGSRPTIFNRIGNSPFIASEIVDLITDGNMSRAQIDRRLRQLEYYRDYHAERGFSDSDLAQYDDAINELRRLRDEVDYDNRDSTVGEATERADEAEQDFLDLEMPEADVRITGDETEREGDPCQIGPYDEMRSICAARGEQAHHIVPDYTLRTGTRLQGDAGFNRVPGMPSMGEGNAICLQGNAAVPGTEHNTAHAVTDSRITQIGQIAGNPVPGTAPLGDVMDASIDGATAAKPECGPQIEAAVDEQFGGYDENRLLRATKYQLPVDPALTALRNGQ
ncbi:MAG: DUF4150 domain-containing protein [Pseudomonadota bacterium]